MAPLPPPTPVTTKREELNEIFVEFLGTRNVYFQPDENTKMEYPAIVYEVDDQAVVYADNTAHRRTDRYQVTAIDRNPDVPVRTKIETLPYCSFSRTSVVEGLNHWIYNLYF